MDDADAPAPALRTSFGVVGEGDRRAHLCRAWASLRVPDRQTLTAPSSFPLSVSRRRGCFDDAPAKYELPKLLHSVCTHLHDVPPVSHLPFLCCTRQQEHPSLLVPYRLRMHPLLRPLTYTISHHHRTPMRIMEHTGACDLGDSQ